MSICGPNSKEILLKIIPDINLSDKEFPTCLLKTSIDNINCGK